MVCPRCLTSVKGVFSEMEIGFDDIRLGEVVLTMPIGEAQKQELAQKLKTLGFELLDDKDHKIINTIKTFLVEFVHYDKHHSNKNLSVALSEHLNKDYSRLSKTFSKIEGTTIEKYMQQQKIEKVKELLSYDEMTISEIAFKLNYSSTAHLSNQFKKVTGLSPTQYKKTSTQSRRSIDEL